MALTRKREFPASACLFRTGIPITVTLAAHDDEEDDEEEDDEEVEDLASGRRFSMVVNTGKIMDHPWWGKFAVNLEGVQIRDRRIAALADHDASKRVGFADPGQFHLGDDGLTIEEGTLLSNPDAQRIADDAGEGFPFQASPMLQPTLILEVGEGETVEVNGNELEGPGTVFEKSILHEVSILSLGADDDTVSDIFAAVSDDEGEVMLSAEIGRKESATMATKKKKKAGTKKKAAKKPVRLAAQNPDELEGADDAGAAEADPPADADAEGDPPTDAEAAAAAAADDTGDAAAELAAAEGDPVAVERVRASTIMAAASADQSVLAKQLVKDGTHLTNALLALQNDSRVRLGGIRREIDTDTDEPLGVGNLEVEVPEGADTKLAAEWRANDKNGASLRKDFDCFEDFVRYRKLELRGNIRILSNRAS